MVTISLLAEIESLRRIINQLRFQQGEDRKRIRDMEASLREIVAIGETTGDEHQANPSLLWIVVGNMQGEAKRVLDSVSEVAA
jgi:hypothetical protein